MTKELITMPVALAIAGAGFFLRRRALQAGAANAPEKSSSLQEKFGGAAFIVGIWLFVVQLLPLVFGAAQAKPFHMEISPERYDILGFSVSSTVITTWIAMAILLLAAVIIRIVVIPHMRKIPKGIQNVLEIMVEGIDNYATSKGGGMGENLSAYLFSIALLLVTCAIVELFGVRAPTSDITMTLALSLITFMLINYYGIRHKGVIGRVKSFAQPSATVFIFRVISDCAIPISMACRLFGNMLGGMVVMDLLYSALGSSAVGIPSVLGLYFNVFHPLIQAFIFITLTLTFINEAAE